jgi:hypothetical protein
MRLTSYHDHPIQFLAVVWTSSSLSSVTVCRDHWLFKSSSPESGIVIIVAVSTFLPSIDVLVFLIQDDQRCRYTAAHLLSFSIV